GQDETETLATMQRDDDIAGGDQISGLRLVQCLGKNDDVAATGGFSLHFTVLRQPLRGPERLYREVSRLRSLRKKPQPGVDRSHRVFPCEITAWIEHAQDVYAAGAFIQRKRRDWDGMRHDPKLLDLV